MQLSTEPFCTGISQLQWYTRNTACSSWTKTGCLVCGEQRDDSETGYDSISWLVCVDVSTNSLTHTCAHTHSSFPENKFPGTKRNLPPSLSPPQDTETPSPVFLPPNWVYNKYLEYFPQQRGLQQGSQTASKYEQRNQWHAQFCTSQRNNWLSATATGSVVQVALAWVRDVCLPCNCARLLNIRKYQKRIYTWKVNTGVAKKFYPIQMIVIKYLPEIFLGVFKRKNESLYFLYCKGTSSSCWNIQLWAHAACG